MPGWIKKTAGCGCIAALAALILADRAETRLDPREAGQPAASARVALRTPALPQRARLVRISDPERETSRHAPARAALTPGWRDTVLSLGLLALLIMMIRKRHLATARLRT